MCTRSSTAGEPELKCGHQWVQVMSTMQLFVRSAGTSVNRIGVHEHWVQCDCLRDQRVQALMGSAGTSVECDAMVCRISRCKHWQDQWTMDRSVGEISGCNHRWDQQVQALAGSVGVSIGRIGGWCTQVLMELVDTGVQWEHWMGQCFGPLTYDF